MKMVKLLIFFLSATVFFTTASYANPSPKSKTGLSESKKKDVTSKDALNKKDVKEIKKTATPDAKGPVDNSGSNGEGSPLED